MSATAYVVTEAYRLGILAMIAGFSILDIIAITLWICVKIFVKEETAEEDKERSYENSKN